MSNPLLVEVADPSTLGPEAAQIEALAVIEMQLWHYFTPVLFFFFGWQIWDILLNLGYDIQYFKKPKFVDWVYLSMRIFSIITVAIVITVLYAGNSSTSFNCAIGEKVNAATFIFSIPSISLLFLIRTCAIWNWNKVVIAGLGFLWIVQLGLACIGAIGISGTNEPLDLTCVEMVDTKFFLPGWIASTVFDTVVMLMTMAKLVPAAMRDRFSVSGIQKLLIKDGLIYFIVTFAISITNIILAAISTTPFVEKVLFNVAIVQIPSVMAAMVYRNLKSFGKPLSSNGSLLPTHGAMGYGRSGINVTKQQSHSYSTTFGDTRYPPAPYSATSPGNAIPLRDTGINRSGTVSPSSAFMSDDIGMAISTTRPEFARDKYSTPIAARYNAKDW